MKTQVALLHGAGYVGGELIRLLLSHSDVNLSSVTSRAFADQPIWKAHPHLKGETDLVFSGEDDFDLAGIGVVLIAAEHGKGVESVMKIRSTGYEGAIIDLSADFRFRDASLYDRYFGFTHAAPDLIPSFVYGLPEVYAPYPAGTRLVANPGCFASGLSLALWPVASNLGSFSASVTALTGASGSGARPKETTHYPTREGNVRAYKVLRHQHLPEIQQVLGDGAAVSFVPVSGPWTRGIWGTAQIQLETESDVSEWFHRAYDGKPFIRLWENELPEMRYSVSTPFCDIGWMVQDRRVVIAFALDNLLKGAASQAVQNLNLMLGLPETTGLLSPTSTIEVL